MKTRWHIARILLGLTLAFSGFVKGIDPLGSAYKFTDYFTAWGMESLEPFAFALGILLAATEFITGIALLFNTFISFFSIIALAFMAFFTVLTLGIAIENPVTDCGCFGDALVLSNWETFYKNIIFSAFAVIVFWYRKRFKPKKQSLITAILSLATVFVFAYLVDYSYKHLPILDFRPYKVGTNIPEAMQIPEGAPVDEYETFFHYKNKETGETKKFDQGNYPWQDTLKWEFVSMDEPVLIKKGYEPPIQNFIMETPDGEDVKDFFLYDEGYTIMMISHDLTKADMSNSEEISKLLSLANQHEINFLALTSSLKEEYMDFANDYSLHIDYFNCDEITLKTMVRSNPGFIMIKKGTIVDKWHHNDIPGEKSLKNRLDFFEKITK